MGRRRVLGRLNGVWHGHLGGGRSESAGDSDQRADAQQGADRGEPLPASSAMRAALGVDDVARLVAVHERRGEDHALVLWKAAQRSARPLKLTEQFDGAVRLGVVVDVFHLQA